MSTDSTDFESLGFGAYPVRCVRHYRVKLPDGCHLAGKLWLPWTEPNDTELFAPHFTELIYNGQGQRATGRKEEFPVILEYLPYRKDDWTVMRDHNRHPWMCSQGFVVARFDLRGSGSSTGHYYDEYEPQEQKDCISLIDWFVQQSWCSGRVGMYGKSWGGFNGLQVAYEQPEALKAIISLYSTDHRFDTDIYYSGGHPTSGLLMWCNQMFLWNSRPPPPEYFENTHDWLEAWKKRIEDNGPSWIERQLSHPSDDQHWQHGSIYRDYDRVKCACLIVGGLSDGYTDGAFRMAGALNGSTRAIVGPWSHDWPDTSTPGPVVDFLRICLDWWNWHLKPEHRTNGAVVDVTQWPRLRAFIRDQYQPQETYENFNGQFVALDDWVHRLKLHEELLEMFNKRDCKEFTADTGFTLLTLTHDNQLLVNQNIQSATDANWMHAKSSPYQGVNTGEWCPFSGAELARDQTVANEHSLCFLSQPISDEMCICGRITAFVTTNQIEVDNRGITIRLCQLWPDQNGGGKSTLISMGHVNASLVQGVHLGQGIIRYRVDLNMSTYRLHKGSHLVLAISPQCFPFTMPPKGINQPLKIDINTSFVVLQTLKMGDCELVQLPGPPKPLLKLAGVELGPAGNSYEYKYWESTADDGVPNGLCSQVQMADRQLGLPAPYNTTASESKVFGYGINASCDQSTSEVKATLKMKFGGKNAQEVVINVKHQLKCDPEKFAGEDCLEFVVNGQDWQKKHWNYCVKR